jgi:DNA-binding HxlR family transcriptional regulator
MAKEYGLSCPVAKTLDIVGERWTLLIVRDFLKHGPRKFQDLEASLGVAPGILSERLKVLEEEGIVSRGFYQEHPPRAQYTLTPKGHDLRTVVAAMAVWGSKHVHPESALVHDACGTPIEVGYYCPECDRRVRKVRLEKQSHHEDTKDTKQVLQET